MSQDYAMSRVKDALEKSDDNHLKAQRLIMSWLENDHTLLFGLVAPHMQAIVAHALNHVAAAPKKKSSAKRIDVKQEKPGEFGLALLETLKGGRATSGMGFGEAPARGAVTKPGKASQKHVDAIHQMAKASKDKNKKK